MRILLVLLGQAWIVSGLELSKGENSVFSGMADVLSNVLTLHKLNDCDVIFIYQNKSLETENVINVLSEINPRGMVTIDLGEDGAADKLDDDYFLMYKKFHFCVVHVFMLNDKGKDTFIQKARKYSLSAWYPVGPNETKSHKVLNIWSEEKGFLIPGMNLFPNKFNNYYGHYFNVSYMMGLHPYSTKYKLPNGTIVIHGLVTLVLDHIARGMNFKYHLIDSDGKFGSIIDIENNEWDGLVGMVKRHEVDFAIGGVYMNTYRANVIDFTFPYVEGGFGFVSHKPKFLPKSLAILWPFGFYVWVGILLSSILFILIFWIVVDRVCGDSYFTLQRCLLNSIMALSYQPVSKWPTSSGGKLLFIIWVIFILFVTFAYSESLISSLVIPQHFKPIDSLEALDKSNYRVAFLAGSIQVTIFQTSKDPLFKRIWQRTIDQGKENSFYNSLTVGLDATAKDDKLAFILAPNIMDANVKSRFTDFSTGETNIHVARQRFHNSGYGFPIQKGQPYQFNFNTQIHRIHQSGLIYKWKDETMQFSRYVTFLKKRYAIEHGLNYTEYRIPSEDSSQVKFSMEHVQGGFYIYLIGHGIGFLSFFYENRGRSFRLIK